MSAGNPILGTQQHFWRKWRKITENRPRPQAPPHKTPPHTAKLKISKNPMIARSRVLQKKCGFKEQLLICSFFHVFIICDFEAPGVHEPLHYFSFPFVHYFIISFFHFLFYLLFHYSFFNLCHYPISSFFIFYYSEMRRCGSSTFSFPHFLTFPFFVFGESIFPQANNKIMIIWKNRKIK